MLQVAVRGLVVGGADVQHLGDLRTDRGAEVMVVACMFHAGAWSDEPSKPQDSSQGFLFDPETLEPQLGVAFQTATKKMKELLEASRGAPW